MARKSKKYNRAKRQARASWANHKKAPETLESLKARLAALPKCGESRKEIAKLTAKIASLNNRKEA